MATNTGNFQVCRPLVLGNMVAIRGWMPMALLRRNGGLLQLRREGARAFDAAGTVTS